MNTCIPHDPEEGQSVLIDDMLYTLTGRGQDMFNTVPLQDWTVSRQDPAGDTMPLSIIDKSGGFIAAIAGYESQEGGPITEAHATLIAAAPRMLRALLDLQVALAHFRDHDTAWRGMTLEEVKYNVVDKALEGLA